MTKTADAVTCSPDMKDRIDRLELEKRHLKRSLEELSVLNDLAAEIGGRGNSSEILATIVRHSITAVGAEQGVITLIDDSTENRKKTLVRIMDPVVTSEAHHLHESFLVWMCRNKQPLLMNTPEKESKLYNVAYDPSIRSILCVPLIVKGVIIGVLTVYNKREQTGFSPDDQRLLAIIASQSAQVIENARLSEREQWMKIKQIEREQQLQQEYLRKLLDAQEQDRRRIADELHDDLAANISSIAMLSEILRNEASAEFDTGQKQQILNRLNAIAHESIHSIRDIVWTIDPRSELLQDILIRFRDITLQSCRASGIQFGFVQPAREAIENITFTAEQKKNFWLILKEAVNNSLKHSGCTSLSLEIHRENNFLTIVLRDNGRGFPASRHSAGKGLNTMKTRAAQLHAVLELTSGVGAGAEIRLKITV